ncbi:MAG: hypothetical protein QF552_06560, partial [Litorilituus sp.]|nr:hypothetical protein [Litorilituus sp.]
VKNFLIVAVTITVVSFVLGVYKEGAEVTIFDFLPYLISSCIGCVLTLIYLKLVSYKSAYFSSTMLFLFLLAIVTSVVVVFSVEYWFLQENCLVATFACCSGMFNFENRELPKKSL